MKRSSFKQKLTKPLKRSNSSLKRTKLKKKSKAKISTIQNKLWEIIKQIVRKKYPPICYTCGARDIVGANCQTGHMWSKASLGAYLKYDLRVLRLQCYSCNINRGGAGADFYAKMLREIGQEEMEKLQKDRQVTVVAYDHYLKLIEEYEVILAELNKTPHIAL
jgi:hypothetical protein